MTSPAGLVKLMTQASGASRGDAAGDVDGDRDGAQPVRDAAGADRLLAEHALGERDPLVDRPAVEAADADRGEHEVGAAQRLVEVGGRGRPRGASGDVRRPASASTRLIAASRSASRSCRTTWVTRPSARSASSAR